MAPSGDSRTLQSGRKASAPAHRSIGEVLALLKDEFPDITISKIRFLESQGLLDPERTPSGYRRFYDKDVERLRWILRQQRENFLPLKVIKGRLAEGADLDDASPPKSDRPSQQTPGVPPSMPAEEAPSVTRQQPAAERPHGASAAVEPAAASAPAAPASPDGAASSAPAPDTAQSQPNGDGAAPSTRDDAPRRVLPEPALFSHKHASNELGVFSRPVGDSSVSLTIEELAAATGMSVLDITELERFGLLEHRPLGPTRVYDEEALLVARAAARFRAHGVEPRHLRMYKVAADREAGVFEQVVLPIVRQRDADARRRAIEVLDELARFGETLHAAMLRRALRDITGP